jgi:hypothetical protein
MLMANDIEPTLNDRGSDAESELEGIGAALMLLTCGLVGALLAVLFRGFHMVWVPVLMPIAIGWSVGSSLGMVQRKFNVRAQLPPLITAVIGACIAYFGYHVLVYDRILDFISGNLPSVMEAALTDPRLLVEAWLEERTGQSGILAYLTFVSEGAGAGVSPLGILGRSEPGLALTCFIMAIDAVIAVISSLFFVRLRGLAPAPAAGPAKTTREEIARTDATNLSKVMRSIDRGDVDSAARILAEPVDEPDYAVAVVYDPDSQLDWELQILSLTSDRPEFVRTSRRLDSWHGQSLMDELELARQQGRASD